MGSHEARTGERRRGRRTIAIALAGAMALTLAACSRDTGSAQQPTRRTVVAAPPAEGCVGIVAVEDGPPTPNAGTPYAITLVGRWGATAKPTGEQLTVTPESPYPGSPDKQPMVAVRPDGSLPEPLTYNFPALEFAARYAIQGTIYLTHGSHQIAPVTPYCRTEVMVPSTPYQEAPVGNATVVSNNN